MRGIVKPLGTILTTLPATTDDDAPRAGASFAFYRSIDYLPHRDAVWVIFDERFGELVDFSAKLPGLEKVHSTIQALSAGLKQHIRQARHPAGG